MEQSFHVLQAVDHKVVTATKCTRYQTRHTLYCGAFSHIKYLIPPTSHETVPVSVAQCEMMKSSGTYQDGKGRIHPIKDGQVLDLSYPAHGSIIPAASNTQCYGTTVSVNGETHQDILVLLAETVKLETVQIKYSLVNKELIDLTAHKELGTTCYNNNKCSTNGATYIIDPPKHLCNLQLIQTALMSAREVVIDHRPRTLLIDAHHKIALAKGRLTAASPNCPKITQMYNTNLDGIFLLASFLPAYVRPVDGTDVNMKLVLQATDSYIEDKLERDILTMTKRSLDTTCEQIQQNLHQVEKSPFSPNSIIKVVGDLFVHYECDAVIAHATIGTKPTDYCLHDYLPVRVNGETVLMSSRLHLIKNIENSDRRAAIPCGNKMTIPKFMDTAERIVHQTPTLEFFKVNLKDFSHAMDSYMANLTISEDDTSKMELYTPEEMNQFLKLIHDGRYQHQMSTKLIHEYCHVNECHEEEMSFTNQMVQQFTPGVWNEIAYVKSKFLSSIAFIGNICAILYFVKCFCRITYRFIKLFMMWRNPNVSSDDIRNEFMPTFNIISSSNPEPATAVLYNASRNTATVNAESNPEQLHALLQPTTNADFNNEIERWEQYKSFFENRQ